MGWVTVKKRVPLASLSPNAQAGSYGKAVAKFLLLAAEPDVGPRFEHG